MNIDHRTPEELTWRGVGLMPRPQAPAPASHTPGPWHVKLASRSAFNESANNGMHGCIANDAGVLVCYLRSEQNARLLASAPDLLNMLRRVLDEYMLRDPANGPIALLTLEQARAALSKAEGRAT